MIERFASAYFADLKRAVDAIPLDTLQDVYDRILGTAAAGGRIFVLGNGGSAATASHFAADLNRESVPGTGKPFKVLCPCDSLPAILATANDRSYAEIFVEPLKNFLEPGDLVLALSSSGNSENVLRAVAFARERGAATVGLTGLPGGKLAERADLALIAPAADCQKAEDIHLILLHVILRAFKAEAARRRA